MKRFRIGLLILVLSVSVAPLPARTIVGLGMSNQAGGPSLNKELARANGVNFLAEQTSIANFEYKKSGTTVTFTRVLKTELHDIKVTKSESFDKNGIIIWLKADAETPRYVDERCQAVKESIRKGTATGRIVLRMLEQSIPELIKPVLQKSGNIKGISYLRDLSITESWFGKLVIKAEVCIAQTKPF